MALPTATEPAPRNRGGRPRDPSRDTVIRTAILRLLADVGYGALTMDAVAAEAGVGKATIYRRWRSKEELVVDTVAELGLTGAEPSDSGTLDGDLRAMMRALVEVVTGPPGAAILSLLSTMPHQPELASAMRAGPISAWRSWFDRLWSRAERRGEVRPGAGDLAREATSALIVQRWLLTGQPVDDAFADEVLEGIVLPLIRATSAVPV